MKKLAATLIAPVLSLLLGHSALAAEETARVRRIDINTATEAEIEATLGVGAAEARRIVEARPYASRDELKTRNVMTPERFEKLKRLIESVC